MSVVGVCEESTNSQGPDRGIYTIECLPAHTVAVWERRGTQDSRENYQDQFNISL